jgi:hypothetical protein
MWLPLEFATSIKRSGEPKSRRRNGPDQRLSRNLDDEGWILVCAPVRRADFIGFMTLNLAHPTSFCSRIIEIAGEPFQNAKIR